jgi:hypothetical protein
MSGTPKTRRPVRIANCSGFFGDRLSAAKEMVTGGPIDVLTGDWLAELTMLILARQRMKHGVGSGYARTFLTQMNDVLAECLDKDIKVVSNAGGLDPEGLAEALRAQASEAGLSPKIAVVTGDDLSGRMKELLAAGEPFQNLDTGRTLAESGVTPLTANAYIGGRGITAALDAGADIVITGRCTDAALLIGPAAWWHSWDYDSRQSLDQLAGALVAGHVIECGAQATGGNYSFFEDIPSMQNIGFPIAEVADSGESVITKHPGTGGLVSEGTVTAQLLYEIGPPEYLNPDVTADFSSIKLDQVGRDRVRISEVVGLAPPDRLKVSMNYLGGFRNTMSLVLTGLDVEAKAALALEAIAGIELADINLSAADLATKSHLSVREMAVTLVRGDSALGDYGSSNGSADPAGPHRRTGAATAAQAQSHLQVTVKDPDPARVGKAFTAPAVESALASYPGMFPTAPPGPGTPYGVFWPTGIAAEKVDMTVTIDGQHVADVPGRGALAVGHEQYGRRSNSVAEDATGGSGSSSAGVRTGGSGETTTVSLGALVGARSGDKGGNANLGVWVPPPTEPESVALAAGLVDAMVVRLVESGDDTAAMWASDWPIDSDPELRSAADHTYAWLQRVLSEPEDIHRLLPDTAGLNVAVYQLPNLRAINVVVEGLLGLGVSENTSLDPQAKGLGELFRAQIVAAPQELVSAAQGPKSGAL